MTNNPNGGTSLLTLFCYNSASQSETSIPEYKYKHCKPKQPFRRNLTENSKLSLYMCDKGNNISNNILRNFHFARAKQKQFSFYLSLSPLPIMKKVIVRPGLYALLTSSRKQFPRNIPGLIEYKACSLFLSPLALSPTQRSNNSELLPPSYESKSFFNPRLFIILSARS